MNNFNEIKLAYYKARKEEWAILRRYLKEKLKQYDIKVIMSGGKGDSRYNSNGKLKVNYNLTNWRWIEIVSDNVTIFVSFQPFDIDEDTDNKHALMDRIGVSWYIGEYNSSAVYKNMIITDFELPLDNANRQKLCKLIHKTLIEHKS